LRAWAQSGFRTLSPASKALRAEQHERLDKRLAASSLDDLLKRYEGPAERALVRATDAVDEKIVAVLVGISSTVGHLHTTLGLKPEPEEAREHATTVAHGRTRAGSRFTINVQPGMLERGQSCRDTVSVEFSFGHQGSGGILSSGPEFCIAPLESSRNIVVDCEEGLLRVAAGMPPSVRRVRLRLSDGSAVTSPTITIPSRLGGPASVYVQAVRGPSPYPVSLTELGAHGRTLRTVPLDAQHDCKREPPAPEPVSVTLARGTTPAGSPFTIRGISFGGTAAQPDFVLNVDAGHLGASTAIELGGPVRPATFRWRLKGECPPHEFAILYGVLKRPGASVLAREPSGLVALHTAPIPKRLHAGGVLAYAALATPPSELIVRRADGHILTDERLAALDREEAEYCAGYAEG
jgi:hypothetical protein